MNFDQIFIEVCINMLNCLQYLHSKYYIHRDVKPENFRVKDKQVYLIDFAMVSKYIDYHEKHIPYRAEKQLRVPSTPLMCSIFAHQLTE